MLDPVHAAFIQDCRVERGVLVGRVAAIESQSPETGTPPAVPANMNEAASAGVARMRRAITYLDTVISEYERSPDAY